MADKILTAQHFSNLRGGTMTLAPGRYVTQTPIVVREASGNLRAHGVTFVGPLEFLTCFKLIVSGAAFDGDRTKRGADGSKPTVRVRACRDWRLEDCDFFNARGDHLYISEESAWGVVRDTVFTEGYRNAIAHINGHHIRYEGVRIRGVNGTDPKAGIDIEANPADPKGCNHDIEILNSHISDCGSRTVLSTGANPGNRITVHGCELLGAVSLPGDDNTVSDCRIDGLGRSHIGIGMQGKRPRVTGNEIVNGKHYAALIVGPDPVEQGNRVVDYAHPDRPDLPIWVVREG